MQYVCSLQTMAAVEKGVLHPRLSSISVIEIKLSTPESLFDKSATFHYDPSMNRFFSRIDDAYLIFDRSRPSIIDISAQFRRCAPGQSLAA